VLLALLLRQRGRPRAPPLRQLSGSDAESGKAGGSAWAHTTGSFTSAATTQCCKRALARGAGPDEHGSPLGSPVAPPAPRAQDRPDGAYSREGTLLGEGTAVLQGLPRQTCAGAAAPPAPPPHRPAPAPPLQRQSRPPSGQAQSRRSSMSASSTESAAGRPRAAARARGAAELPSWDAACDAAAAGCVQPGALQLQLAPRTSARGGALGPGPALARLDTMAGGGGSGSMPAPALAPPGRSPFAAVLAAPAASSLTCSPPGSNRSSAESCLRSAGGGAQAGGCGCELRRIGSAGTAAALAAGVAAGAQRSLDSLGVATGLLAPRAAVSSLGAPMPRRCSIERAASAGDAEWAADGRMLALGTGDLNIRFCDLKFIRSIGAGAPSIACPPPCRGVLPGPGSRRIARPVAAMQRPDRRPG